MFTNFQELCKLMNRSQEHVMQYLLSELGANGSLDAQNRLIVKGRFLPKVIYGRTGRDARVGPQLTARLPSFLSRPLRTFCGGT